MLEKIPQPNSADKEIGKIDKEITFPQGESILRMFRKKYEGESAKAEIVETILYEFFKQELDNIEIYTSEKLGAAFPWTVLRTRELLKKVIEKSSDLDGLDREFEVLTEDDSVDKQEFIFSSRSLMKSGDPFTFVEEAMHQTIIALKSDLLALQEGRKIMNREIYTLGLPTNELGKVSQDFVNKVKDDPFEVLGELQSEFVQAHIPKNEDEVQSGKVRLYGISTGASLAAATGERLLASGAVSQDADGERKDVPRLSIRMDSPVGLSESTTRKWQIPLGYTAEFSYQIFKDPKLRLADPMFKNRVKHELKRRNIEEHTTDDDVKMKKDAISAIVGRLIEGVEFDENLKVTKVSGLVDPLTFSWDEYEIEKARQVDRPDSLGKSISPRTHENRREFMIHQTHTPAFFRDNELRRYYEVASSLEKLKR